MSGAVPHHMQDKTSKRRIKSTETTREALRFRKLGYSYVEIGERVGISRNMAYAAVKKELDLLKQDCTEIAEEIRNIELERLDQLYAVAAEKALSGELTAIDRCLKIQDRRAKLLGLDAAQKIDQDTSVIIRFDAEDEAL